MTKKIPPFPLLIITTLSLSLRLQGAVVDFVQWGSNYNMRRIATSAGDSTPVRGSISPNYSFSNLDLGIGDAGSDDSRSGNTLSTHLSGLIDPGGVNLSTRTFSFAGEQIRADANPSSGNRNIGATSGYSTSNDWRGNGFEQYALYAWNQSEFLSAEQIDLSDPNSRMEVVVRAFTNNVSGSGVHFVINNGGTWYYSQAAQTGAGSFSLSNPGAAQWASFNPQDIGSTARAMAMPSGGSFGNVVFDDVQAVGFASEVIRTSNSESRQGYDNFVFTANAIPEPGTLALLGMSMLALLSRRTRQH